MKFCLSCLLPVCFLALILVVNSASAGAPEQGYHHLLESVYLTADFEEDDIQNVWKVWPEPLRTQAENASPLERRKMTFERYGLTPRPGEDFSSANFKPLQYVVSESGTWTMNCFSCHGGQIMGNVIPGLPNNRYALQTLSEEMRQFKLEHAPQKSLTRMEKAVSLVPLGSTRGTTNAVMFGVGLLSMRDADLNVKIPLFPPRMVHHDMDAPAWWLFKKKTHLYVEAYAEKNHRSLMQFMLIRSNGPEKFREWEDDFKEVYAYLESIEAPRYPFPIDADLAKRGEVLFQNHCAECHGTYGPESSFPNRVVSMKELKTDPVRFGAILSSDRTMYGKSWFAEYGKHNTIGERDGYLAPPLDGVWASGPYFHNGSVPTLWDVLNPSERPQVWQRTSTDGFDREKVGIPVERMNRVPAEIQDPRERREFFDTTQFGKSASGHDFPDALSEKEKRAVLEYLKSL
ncbi:hypothetical protein [Planctomicrobium sp. SH527]|uniref:c-type cytochrome n=1 Tax=Planctomicrobium sp. SH527 TaxID=3448123 RepID=UPI003F5CAD83